MAMAVRAMEASRIISLKYPDLADGFEPRSSSSRPPAPPPQLQPRLGKRPHSPHPNPAERNLHPRMGFGMRMGGGTGGGEEEMKMKNLINSERANKEVLYPSMYSAEDDLYFRHEDAFVLSLTPLRAQALPSILYPERAVDTSSGSTPSRASKRPKLRHDSYSTGGRIRGGEGGGPGGAIKRKFLRFCGASRSIFGNKYMGIPG